MGDESLENHGTSILIGLQVRSFAADAFNEASAGGCVSAYEVNMHMQYTYIYDDKNRREAVHEVHRLALRPSFPPGR